MRLQLREQAPCPARPDGQPRQAPRSPAAARPQGSAELRSDPVRIAEGSSRFRWQIPVGAELRMGLAEDPLPRSVQHSKQASEDSSRQRLGAGDSRPDLAPRTAILPDR
eukprot:3342968-Alexandrium_andersonii.AAC.1